MSAIMHVEDQVKQWLADEVPPELLTTPLPDDMAREVIARLRHEFNHYWYVNPNQCLKYAECIIAIGTARNDLGQIALGLMSKSDALASLGQMYMAWDFYEQAGETFKAVGDEVGWGRTRVGRLYLGPKLNRIPLTLAEAEQARAIFTRHGELDRLLRLDWQMALIHNYIGEQHQALKLFAAAVTRAESLGEAGHAHIGPLYMNIGLTHYALGDLHQALDYYERARKIMTGRNETLLISNVEANIAQLFQAQGDYRHALTLLHGALERAADQSPFEIAMTKQHMVECYLSLNRFTEARDLAKAVIKECRTFNSAYELARTLLLLATADAAVEDFDAAYVSLEEAERIFSSLGAKTWMATIRLWRGRMALKQGNAESAYRDAVDAEASFGEDGQQVNSASAILLQGQALFALGKVNMAAEVGHKALSVAQHYSVPSLRYAAHLLLGQIVEANPVKIRAIRHYRAAIATVERMQRGLTITFRSGFLEDKGGAMRALIALHLRAGDTKNAFEALEHAKSQAWLGYLINRGHLRWAQDDPRSLALIKELDSLRAEHEWFYQLAHNPSRDAEFPNAVPQAQALSEVAVREHRMRSITDQLYLYNGKDQPEEQVPVLLIEEIQQCLEEGTLLVEYYREGDKLWAFTLDRDLIKVHALPTTTADVNHLTRILRNNFDSALQVDPDSRSAQVLVQQSQKILRRLYAGLIEPLGLKKNRLRKLIIAPYGTLHTLPFHLLYDGSKYLIEHYEVVNLPAAGLVTRRAPKRTLGALVLGHSWDGRLPHTHSEAELVYQLFGGQLFVDDAVNRSNLKRAPTQILHIAAHGKYRLDQPDLSYIQLADGQLYTDDVLQLDLSYELVTLSACETGLANVAADEALIGLGRGFLYAGAGALMLSLWSVNDYLTLNLIKRMYGALKRGKSKSASLRHAQLSIIDENRNLHPAYWGAFQLIGDDSALSVATN